jgi:hypothetical protein
MKATSALPLFLLALAIAIGCNNHPKTAHTVIKPLQHGQTKADSERNDSIAFAQIEKLPEYKHMEEDFDKRIKDTAYHFTVLLNQEPDTSFKYYWMKVGTDGPDRFSTWEHFYVDPHNWSVYHYDTASDSILSIAQWRKSGKDDWLK